MRSFVSLFGIVVTITACSSATSGTPTTPPPDEPQCHLLCPNDMPSAAQSEPLKQCNQEQSASSCSAYNAAYYQCLSNHAPCGTNGQSDLTKLETLNATTGAAGCKDDHDAYNKCITGS